MSSSIQQQQKAQEAQQDQIAKDLTQLDTKLGKLKSAYDQYFLGIERVEPVKLRKEVADLIKKYSGASLQNSSLKFKLNTLVSRYNAFTNLWNRTLREIEAGTYNRHQFKLKISETSSTEENKAASKTKGKEGAASSDPISYLLNQYVTAKKQNNESIDGITREALEKVIRQQTEAIKKQYQCQKVNFKVVVEKGKAKIKASPKN